jgi:hypothetical protein
LKPSRRSLVKSALDESAAVPHTQTVHGPLLTVVETAAFARRAEKLLTLDEYEEMMLFLALHPESGDEIQGTGGVRKVRFRAKGRGKSGGVRVIYYFYDKENPVFAIFLYAKNEQVEMTPEQKRYVTAFAESIRADARARRKT